MLPDDLTKSSLTACPVPPEQLPLNEYEELRESWFFRWAMLETQPFIQKMLWVWAISWTIAAPVAAASFTPGKSPVKFLLISAIGASFFLCLVLSRLYLGWAYVSARLVDTTVVYEESGWYDGQKWTKPIAVLTRDRLVVSYQIAPLLKRMQLTFVVLGALLIAAAIVWQVL